MGLQPLTGAEFLYDVHERLDAGLIHKVFKHAVVLERGADDRAVRNLEEACDGFLFAARVRKHDRAGDGRL